MGIESRPRLNQYQNEVVRNLKGDTDMQRWVILPDPHRPFHNKVLWAKVMQMLHDMGKGVHGLVLSGDYADMYTLGSYNHQSLYNLRGKGVGIDGLDLGLEYDDCNVGLDEIDSALNSDAKRIFLYGNHEDRFFRERARGDNDKYGDAFESPTKALRLRERGYDVYENYGEDYVTLGEHLDILHGNYTNKYCAEKHLRMHRGSCMFGHSHVVQTFQLGKEASYNIGWMGDPDHPVFRYSNADNRRRWANSFSIVNIDDNGDFYVQIASIYNNRFFINGKMY